MNEILEFLRAHLGKATLPYYACNYIHPGTVYSIENGKLKYNSRMMFVEYLQWKKRCKEELGNSTIVDFNWKGNRHEVIFLPCTENMSGSMVACFDHDGTWMHIAYNEKKNEFVVYCNFLMIGDYEFTRLNLEVINIIKPKF